MQSTRKPLRIALVQTGLAWLDQGANLERFEALIAEIGDAELVLLPEMFSTGFTVEPELLAESMEGPTIAWMRGIARERRVVLGGSLIICEQGKYFNRFIWMLPNGELAGYDKRHLFSYAGEDRKFSAGSRRLICSVNGWRCLIQICYDLRFPVWMRQSRPGAGAGAPEYDLILCVANWPASRSHAWRTLLQARAIENQCYVAGLNRIGLDGLGIRYSGDSMIVGPDGKILLDLEDRESIGLYTLDGEALDRLREKMPFLRDADPFLLLSGAQGVQQPHAADQVTPGPGTRDREAPPDPFTAAS